MPRDYNLEDEEIEREERDIHQDSPAEEGHSSDELIHQMQYGSEARDSGMHASYYEAAETALEKNEITQMHQLYARRYASEAAAKEILGDDAVNLDELADDTGEAAKLKLKGGNYPIYDLTSGQEVASVKTHWDANGELSESALQAYKRDFLKMRGYSWNVNALEGDGERIIAVRDEAGVPVPKELENATAGESAHYLRDHSVMRIPEDHVVPVREQLIEEAQKLPENYGLTTNASEEEIRSLGSRIQSIGLSSNELLDIIERRTGRRY